MSGIFWTSYALLWALVAVLVVAVFALYHHFGQMYVNSDEGRANQGPENGKPYRPVQAETLDGTTIALPLFQRPFLAIFTSPDCQLCAAMRDALVTVAQQHPGTGVVVFCAGRPQVVRAWAGPLADVAMVVADPKDRIAAMYGIDATPFGIAIDANGIVRARGIVNDLQGLEGLVYEANPLPVLEETGTPE